MQNSYTLMYNCTTAYLVKDLWCICSRIFRDMYTEDMKYLPPDVRV